MMSINLRSAQTTAPSCPQPFPLLPLNIHRNRLASDPLQPMLAIQTGMAVGEVGLGARWVAEHTTLTNPAELVKWKKKKKFMHANDNNVFQLPSW